MLKVGNTSVIVLMAVFAILVVGCSSNSESTTTEADKNTDTENKEVENTEVEIPSRVMNVGSASSGSLYVTYTAAWTDMLMKNIDGLNMVVEPGGSSQNIQNIHSGDADFGITASLQAYPGYYGLGWAEGTEYQEVNSLFPSYSYEGVLFTTASSDVQTLDDLNGKNIALGYAGGGSDFTGREILEFFDVEPKEIINASWTDVGGMLSDGLVDAVYYLAGHPASFIEELEVQHDLKFIPIGDDNLQKFQDEKPYYVIGTLESGIYQGMTEDYKALQGWNFIAASPELPEDLVYLLTKTTWENVSDIHNAHNSFVQTDLSNLKYVNLPLHPGALKYYEEIGAELPELPSPPNK